VTLQAWRAKKTKRAGGFIPRFPRPGWACGDRSQLDRCKWFFETSLEELGKSNAQSRSFFRPTFEAAEPEQKNHGPGELRTLISEAVVENRFPKIWLASQEPNQDSGRGLCCGTVISVGSQLRTRIQMHCRRLPWRNWSNDEPRLLEASDDKRTIAVVCRLAPMPLIGGASCRPMYAKVREGRSKKLKPASRGASLRKKKTSRSALLILTWEWARSPGVGDEVFLGDAPIRGQQGPG